MIDINKLPPSRSLEEILTSLAKQSIKKKIELYFSCDLSFVSVEELKKIIERMDVESDIIKYITEYLKERGFLKTQFAEALGLCEALMNIIDILKRQEKIPAGKEGEFIKLFNETALLPRTEL